MPAKPKSKSTTKSTPKKKAPAPPAGETVYRFKVRLIGGPFALAKGQRKPVRVIDIRGDQTLDVLHEAIFYAFDREDMHLYEFQIGGGRPLDNRAELYGLPGGMEESKDARKTKIASLKLWPGCIFFYWFDFGDDWWHEITLEIVLPAEADVEYPILVKAQGASPPQYPDEEEEDEEYEDEDDEDEDEDEGDEESLEETLEAVKVYLADYRKLEKAEGAIEANLRAIRSKSRCDVARLAEILVASTTFCATRLDLSYAGVCLNLLIEVDQDTKLPLDRGAVAGWAAALVHVAGVVNYLGDPGTEPYMKLGDIAGHFGVSPATMANKSRDIRKVLDIAQLEPRFSTLATLANNPLVWFRPNADGLIFDLRAAPREVQEQAHAAGLIPWIPADHPELHPDRHPQGGPQSARAGDKAAPKKDAPEKNAPQVDPRQGSLLDIMPGGKKKRG